jgi:hypothetical protein
MAQPLEGRLLLALAGWSPPDAIHVAWCSQRCAACHRAAGTAARAASAGPPSSCAMAAQDRRAQIQTLSQASSERPRPFMAPPYATSFRLVLFKRKSRQRPAKIMHKQRRHVPHPTSMSISTYTHATASGAQIASSLSCPAQRGDHHDTTQSQKCGEHEAEPRRAPRQPCASPASPIMYCHRPWNFAPGRRWL